MVLHLVAQAGAAGALAVVVVFVSLIGIFIVSLNWLFYPTAISYRNRRATWPGRRKWPDLAFLTEKELFPAKSNDEIS